TRVDGQLCPRGDVDWYRLDVPAGADLIDVTVGYADAPTRVSIVAQLVSAADGKPVPGAELADTRTGVRKGTLSSTLRVPARGSYLVSVRDSGSESDSLNSYVLQVTTAKDPDTHEPNDDPALAHAPDGMPGWLAYRGDHDVYKVNVAPGSSLL